MKQLLAALALVLALTSGAVSAQTYFRNGQPITEAQYKASNLNTEALNLIRANSNEKAIEILIEALKLDPELSQAHHNLGLAYSKTGNNQKAVEELKQAVDLNPQATMSWLTLGGVYQSSGRLEEALDIYKETLKRFPDFPDRAEIKGLISKLKEESARQKSAGSSADNDSYYRQVTTDNPIRWCSNSLPIRVAITDGREVPNFQPEFMDIAKGSFMDWASASQGRIRLVFVSDPRAADIEVVWTANPKDLPNPAEAGFADFSYRGNCLTKGTIKLLTVSMDRSQTITEKHLRKACLHEVGHILGLRGHSPDPADVMFYSLPVEDKWLMPSARDVETIVRLYSEPSLDRRP
ncbi:MAG: tetratricopeptide repeat protein [Candidatus Obscuribacterales bacterium]|nr:tetratricopeptide repeat protein [Candidatus Obscuribacterales bacterium]